MSTPGSSSAPYAIYNVEHGSPICLTDFVKVIEYELGFEAKKNFCEMQLGDISQTYAATEDLFMVTRYKPKVAIKKV